MTCTEFLITLVFAGPPALVAGLLYGAVTDYKPRVFTLGRKHTP